jgi:predicted transcriptional regulator
MRKYQIKPHFLSSTLHALTWYLIHHFKTVDNLQTIAVVLRHTTAIVWRLFYMEMIKLYDSELKIMDIIWENEPVSAKEISLIAADIVGWNKNTTYTIIKKLIEKNAIERTEPNYVCTSLVKKEDVQKAETQNLIDKLYNGSRKAFFAAFIEENISDDEFAELKRMIEKR